MNTDKQFNGKTALITGTHNGCYRTRRRLSCRPFIGERLQSAWYKKKILFNQYTTD